MHRRCSGLRTLNHLGYRNGLIDDRLSRARERCVQAGSRYMGKGLSSCCLLPASQLLIEIVEALDDLRRIQLLGSREFGHLSVRPHASFCEATMQNCSGILMPQRSASPVTGVTP